MLWSTGGYRPATHEIVPGIVAPTASDTHGQARDLGVLLSVLRRRLICGLLGRCEIRPSLVGSRIFRRPAILRALWPLWLKALVVLAMVLGTLLVGMVGRHLPPCVKGSGNASVQYGETRRPSGTGGQTQQSSSRLEHARRVLRGGLFGLGSAIRPNRDGSVKWRATGVVLLA